jgi:hypothetical protein
VCGRPPPHDGLRGYPTPGPVRDALTFS